MGSDQTASLPKEGVVYWQEGMGQKGAWSVWRTERMSRIWC